jgi:hypothetical protein
MAFIKTLRDKINNIVYPQTHAKAVAMDNTETLDDLNQKLLRAEDYVDTEDVSLIMIPIATRTSLGVIKVGEGLTIDVDGVLSATGTAVADSIAWENIIGKPDIATQEYVDNLVGNAEALLIQIDTGEGVN